jgi:hypothetical protein
MKYMLMMKKNIFLLCTITFLIAGPIVKGQGNAHNWLDKDAVADIHKNTRNLINYKILNFFNPIGQGRLAVLEYRKYVKNLDLYFTGNRALVVDDLIMASSIDEDLPVGQYLDKLYQFFNTIEFSYEILDIGPVLYNKAQSQYFLVAECKKTIKGTIKKGGIDVDRSLKRYFTLHINPKDHVVKIASIVNKKPSINNRNIEVIYTGIKKTGFVLFETKPGKCGLEINGKYRGLTPYQAELPEGRHTFSASKKFYTSVDSFFVVGPNKTTSLFVELPPNYGSFFVNSSPPGRKNIH